MRARRSAQGWRIAARRRMPRGAIAAPRIWRSFAASIAAAAVVGVVASLAVFFSSHVFFVNGRIDPLAIAISVAACVALFRFKAGTIKTIAACAVAGLVLSYWHG